MLKEIIDAIQEKLGNSVNVFYQKGNVYIDYPEQKRGRWIDANDEYSLIKELFDLTFLHFVEEKQLVVMIDEYGREMNVLYGKKSNGDVYVVDVPRCDVPMSRRLKRIVAEHYIAL